MTDRPQWPDSLPAPMEIRLLPAEHPISREDLVAEDGTRALIHDLYWFPEDGYFIYFQYKSTPPEGFSPDKLEQMGIGLTDIENYYFRRPYSLDNPERFSYVRIEPGCAESPWQKTLVETGPM